MRRHGIRILFGLAAAFAATYIIDSAVWLLRKDPTGTVTVHPYTAVARNDKREELIFDSPRDESCANALFPHNQMSPCWYLRKHPEKRTSL